MASQTHRSLDELRVVPGGADGEGHILSLASCGCLLQGAAAEFRLAEAHPLLECNAGRHRHGGHRCEDRSEFTTMQFPDAQAPVGEDEAEQVRSYVRLGAVTLSRPITYPACPVRASARGQASAPAHWPGTLQLFAPPGRWIGQTRARRGAGQWRRRMLAAISSGRLW